MSHAAARVRSIDVLHTTARAVRGDDLGEVDSGGKRRRHDGTANMSVPAPLTRSGLSQTPNFPV